GLYVAGEDAGGVHGANRLGGNGVANSTVFGGIAGDSMAAFVMRNPYWRDPDGSVLDAAVSRAEQPFSRRSHQTMVLRDQLASTMWDDVGVMRTADGVRRAQAQLQQYQRELLQSGVPDGQREFNLTWHDWLNLHSLLTISEVIAQAALAREDSRGAHFREDFPETSDLAGSTFTSITLDGDALKLQMKPVKFDIVSP